MGASREQIIDHLDELLEIAEFDDHGPNGLQVPGTDVVERVVSGVSAAGELLERAAAGDAQLVLVHHGLLWDFQPRRLTPVLAARLRTLLGAGINLAAYHLPLDAHAELGNNALIARALGLRRLRPFGSHRGRKIGWAGELPDGGLAVSQLRRRLGELTGSEALWVGSGPDPVRSVGIVSGAAAGSLQEAIADGLDAFVTGEPAEHVYWDAREAGVHFVAAGHYATETFGIRALGELVAERFGVEHEFVDLPNPI